MADTDTSPFLRKLLRRSLFGLLAVLLLAALVTAPLWWSLRTPSGSAWLLSWLPGAKITAPQGELLGDFSAQRIEIDLPGGARLVLTGLRWRGLRIESWRGRWASPHVQFSALEADRVEWLSSRSSGEPLAEPPHLQLPLWLEVQALRVGEFHAAALGDKPLRDIRARLNLGGAAGREHHIDALTFAWDRLQAQGDASIASTAPMNLRLHLDVQQDAAAADARLGPWRAVLDAQGPLARPVLGATLRATPPRSTAGKSSPPAPMLDVQATLAPFAAWPLAQLAAQTQALDLSALHSAAPITLLAGSATAETSAATQPVTIQLDLSNDAAGRWNEGRLPVRAAKLELRGRADDRSTLELLAFELQLGNAAKAGGQVQGKGRWAGTLWSLEALLADVRPAQLDARLAEMRLSGPLSLAGRGFANPLVAAPAPAGVAEIDVRGELAGQLLAKGPLREVRLHVDARANADEIELRRLDASAGGAKATLAGSAKRTPGTAKNVAPPWQVQGQASLANFDPLPWFAGREDSPWRRGPHRANAKAEWNLSLPQALLSTGADPRTLVARLATLRGAGTVTVTDSVLAGVPLAGTATLRSVESGARIQTKVSLDAGGNTFKLDGLVDARADGPDAGAADHWELDAQAPALARLAPLLALAGVTQINDKVSGLWAGNASATGRWPTLATQGLFKASALRADVAGGLSIADGQLRWQIGTAPGAPAELNLSVNQASVGRLHIDTLQAALQGTAQAHTFTLRGQTRGGPPEWTQVLQAGTPTAAEHTLATLQGQGALVAAGPGAPLWRGKVQQLELRSSAPNAPAWLRAQDLSAELQGPSSSAPARASVAAGRAEILGAALRWDRAQWQAGSGAQAAQIDLHAELEPLPVAPLLRRLQPEFGWGGDLHMAGEITLRSAPQFSADVVVQRQRGDLSVTDETGTQSLGLSDLRLSLAAQDGQWSFTQAFAGSSVGVAAGAITLRTGPEKNWPPPETPIQGVLEARVANLGVWGAWVPAGWRLTGQLGTTASIAGRFNAPEFTGEVRGSGLGVRNLLEGVNVTDGELQIALQGASARIERMQARGGAGSVRLEGSAGLGAKAGAQAGAAAVPRAQLRLVADKFQVLGRVDRRIVASGEGALKLEGDALELDGRFTLDEGLIDFTRSDAPGLSDDVTVTHAALKRDAADAAEHRPAARPHAVTLDLSLGLGDKLRLRGRGIDTGLRGDLKLTSSGGGRLAVNGSVRAEGGTYAAYSQKLGIDRGVITFNGPLENPRLDIEATRPNIDVRAGVAISGNALNPRVRLFSEPEMSDTDKLSYLVLGRASEGLGRTETALLQRAAVALLAGEGEGPVTKLTQAIGLDELSLRQTDGEVRETIVTLGKQLSRRWYVGYERGLNATAGTWQLIYRIAQRFTLRAQSGLDNSLDLIWTWRWQ